MYSREKESTINARYVIIKKLNFVLTLVGGQRETITVLETISGDGRVLPPMIIYKGKAHYRHWHNNLGEEDKDTVFAYSDKGWTNQILGVEYLRLLFEPMIAPKGSEKDNWRLLIVDGHNSHFSTEFISFCEEHRIELFCIPPHTTYILQPLDVGLFSPLQHYYSKGVENFMRVGQESVHKGTFLP